VRAVRPVAVLFSLLVTLALAWGASAADRLVIWDKTEYIPFYNEFMAQFVQAWSEATGIEVEYTVVPPRDLITKLMTAVESGHVPDIATVEVGMVAQLAGMGATTITADLLAAIEAQTGDRFSEAAVRLVSIDGQPRGVPTATFPAALFYRNDLLEAAGVEPPQTIAAFREVARRTNNPRAGIYGAGIPLGRSGGNDIEGFIRNLFWANGGSVFAEDGRTVVVDSPQNVEVFQMLVEMYHQDKTIPPGALSWDDGGNNNAYMAGTAVMVFNSGSLWANMADMGHPLLAHTGVTLMPAGPQGRYNLGGGNTMVLFAGGNVAAAERFIRDFMTPEHYGQLLPRMAPMWAPVLEGMKDLPFYQDPVNRVWLEAGQINVNVGYPGPATPWAGEVLSSQVLLRALQTAIVDGVPPAEALQNAKREIEAIMAKY